jgi:hypothetical protein
LVDNSHIRGEGEAAGLYGTKIVIISDVYPELRTECLIRGYIFFISSSHHLFCDAVLLRIAFDGS